MERFISDFYFLNDHLYSFFFFLLRDFLISSFFFFVSFFFLFFFRRRSIQIIKTLLTDKSSDTFG